MGSVTFTGGQARRRRGGGTGTLLSSHQSMVAVGMPQKGVSDGTSWMPRAVGRCRCFTSISYSLVGLCECLFATSVTLSAAVRCAVCHHGPRTGHIKKWWRGKFAAASAQICPGLIKGGDRQPAKFFLGSVTSHHFTNFTPSR